MCTGVVVCVMHACMHIKLANNLFDNAFNTNFNPYDHNLSRSMQAILWLDDVQMVVMSLMSLHILFAFLEHHFLQLYKIIRTIWYKLTFVNVHVREKKFFLSLQILYTAHVCMHACMPVTHTKHKKVNISLKILTQPDAITCVYVTRVLQSICLLMFTWNVVVASCAAVQQYICKLKWKSSCV